MRIVRVLARRQRTAKELAEQLPDVPMATLYRHLTLMVDAEVIRIIEEYRVRGAVERVYALGAGAAPLASEDVTNATREDHFRYFATFLANLLGEFGRYLDRDQVDIHADGTIYQEYPLRLDDDEYETLFRGIGNLMKPYVDNVPRPGRKTRLFATVVFPTDDQFDEQPDTPDDTKSAGDR